ncbi:hypothetical protein BASA50_009375 [Batrachochytrium salamandrivorans]|uniref:EF-hand domain-containing protein n=1 Tax=Batrachochytrium salamandrivorans TaxID=1357716 RepID=A0ABQ8F1Z3_9FUNG|nr:hypothetical protein BASA61_005963 [Batrachochytrium salamandrivorans]KAH6590400.1 hypothetical protein BASA50_009375 [Batrachochytrium salamandrivorans]KAH9246173.1 hypothetical protein BASA81_016287 [Batrachochytrium salamandrivorans]
MSLKVARVAAPDVPGLYPSGHARRIGPAESFAMSAIAPAFAVLFTNPFDTIKVRLQLQGQSFKKLAGSSAPLTIASDKAYRNSADAFVKILKNEGLRGLQKGLTPAILRESSKNLFRLGMYDPIISIIHDSSQGRAPAWKRMLAGSICGVMGAVSCNPFELVKTRLQSSATGSLAVGHQHGYTGVWNALGSIYRKEGITGWYRGSILSMFRSIVGSGTNLAWYSLMNEYLTVEMKWKDNALLDMVCGLSSGIVSCAFMNPIDVVRTRFYNQPYVNGKGELYSSGLDAVRKIAHNEGFRAFYKGFFTHFLRIGPHFCLTFVFLGMLRRGLSRGYEYLDARDAFTSFDLDGDGVLDEVEVESALTHIIIQPGEPASVPVYRQRIMDKADHHHNHILTFDEFRDLEREVKAIVIEKRK